MRYASDFRSLARDALRGRWGVAVLAGLIASLLGAISSGPEINLNFSDGSADFALEYGGQEIFSTAGGAMPELQAVLMGGVTVLILAAIAVAVVFFVLGSVVGVGYSRFHLQLNDRQTEVHVGTLFDYFPHWKNVAVTKLLENVYIFLWTLLLIVPGIIASYSYAMTDFILAENPELEPREALERSKAMMEGNRWRLFCLHFSFIGWGILAALTLGIGNLWLTPYQKAAVTAFYREVSGTEAVL